MQGLQPLVGSNSLTEFNPFLPRAWLTVGSSKVAVAGVMYELRFGASALLLGCSAAGWGLMDGELAVLAGEVSPYLTAAVGAYGGAVLARVRDQAVDSTVGLGRRMLQRVFGTHAAGDVPQPVADLAADPGDPDLQAALRVAIRKMLTADAELAGDLRGMPAGAVAVSASGERSIAAQMITGVASTGDDATITR
jgi:hypothetical protein